MIKREGWRADLPHVWKELTMVPSSEVWILTSSSARCLLLAMITIHVILQPQALGLRGSPTCPVSRNQRQGFEPPVTLQGLYVAHVLPELSRHSELRAFQLGIVLICLQCALPRWPYPFPGLPLSPTSGVGKLSPAGKYTRAAVVFLTFLGEQVHSLFTCCVWLLLAAVAERHVALKVLNTYSLAHYR